MGKRLQQQARGKGSPRYLSPSHRYIGAVKYKPNKSTIIKNIIHAPGRTTPIAISENSQYICPEGIFTGQDMKDYIKSLSEIQSGTKIFNIELVPGDGGKLCRTAGTFAIMITSGKDECIIELPSKTKKKLSSSCLATIGIASGAGRREKPMRKAGTLYHINRGKGKTYPRVSGVSQNAVDHPFGGSANPGKHKTVSRNAPPGRKVGNIAARRTGKRKR
ncbi:MAG: 50S ribosomal protein L2 [Candidatus Aenigmarchaeota archaeon]|nr:50S ribosomal protein L2 [Candidatus Aenigmarchaeota archaeon]